MLRYSASYVINSIKLMTKKKKKSISLSYLLPDSNPAGFYILECATLPLKDKINIFTKGEGGRGKGKGVAMNTLNPT